MTYRILFAPDSIHWINDKANNRKDSFQAVMEANETVWLNPFASVKVINATTKQVIYEKKGAKA